MSSKGNLSPLSGRRLLPLSNGEPTTVPVDRLRQEDAPLSAATPGRPGDAAQEQLERVVDCLSGVEEY